MIGFACGVKSVKMSFRLDVYGYRVMWESVLRAERFLWSECYVFYFVLWESVLCCGRRVDGYSVMWESVLSFILRAE